VAGVVHTFTMSSTESQIYPGIAAGSQRGLEYDTMSGLYALFVDTEVLPLVEQQYNVKLTKDPDARATMGCSSGGSAAYAP
jgi:enterochelin esterase family protein